MFVILSPTRLCADANIEAVNGLLCTTVRPPGRPAKPHGVYLDTADGLDWLTAVRCNIVFHFAKSAARAHRGLVSTVRRREIAHKIQSSLELPS